MQDVLRTAVARELAGVPPKAIAAATQELSHRYREGHGRRAGAYLRSDANVAAYAAYRLPATAAAVAAGLTQVRDRLPVWRPRRLLDAGAGPGAGAWAALDVWPDIEHVTLIERDERMVALGRRLAAEAPPALRDASWQVADLTSAWSGGPYDLVVASYVLGELSPEQREVVAARFWNECEEVLIAVEPGTPVGYSIALAVRGQLLALGATTVAPCPHDRRCPMEGNDWCHFAERVARTQAHRTAKGATLSYEDEKFSYVAMGRFPGEPIAARVVRHPQTRPGHIRLELCAQDGLEQRVVSRKEGLAYRRARKLRWGDALEE